MKTAAEKTVEKVYDIFNQRNWSALADIVDTKFVGRDMQTNQEYKGVSGLTNWLQSWSNLSTNMQCDSIKCVASSETTVVIEGHASGKNDGPIQTPTGQTLKASGKPLDMIWVDIIELKGGKICAQRTYYDTNRMLTQLGLGQQTSQGQNQTQQRHAY
jgi:hypothetical protein